VLIPIGWLALIAVKRRQIDPRVAINSGGLGSADGSE